MVPGYLIAEYNGTLWWVNDELSDYLKSTGSGVKGACSGIFSLRSLTKTVQTDRTYHTLQRWCLWI